MNIQEAKELVEKINRNTSTGLSQGKLLYMQKRWGEKARDFDKAGDFKSADKAFRNVISYSIKGSNKAAADAKKKELDKLAATYSK